MNPNLSDPKAPPAVPSGAEPITRPVRKPGGRILGWLGLLLGLCWGGVLLQADEPVAPVRLAIAGLSHDHARGFLPSLAKHPEVVLVGIVETNTDLIARYSGLYHLRPELFYPSLPALFAAQKVELVATFTSVYEHQAVVAACAAQRVDVMMEKPLAVNGAAARAMAAAVQQSGIQAFVNYETSWYPGNWHAYTLVHDQGRIGPITRMVFHHGHPGPQEIGCSTNFLAWLTDPVLNGGGALNDFGCYGADLATWFMDGRAPDSVLAVTHQYKPAIYPKVEDEATVILSYPHAEVVVQPSWNWPVNRKDMEVYGQTGYVLVPQAEVVKYRGIKDNAETELKPPALTGAQADAIAYLVAVERHQLKPSGLASLAVNLTVVQILDAAHESARTGRRVDLGPGDGR